MPWVRSYVRSDGTRVRGHSRWAPGARREVTVFGAVALAVVAFGNGSSSGPGEGVPRPRSTVQYPVRFDDVPPVRVRVRVRDPQPTVSYPIRWER